MSSEIKDAVEVKREKRKYVKPEIESEKVFEQNALACAKCPNVSSVSLLGSCVRGVSKAS